MNRASKNNGKLSGLPIYTLWIMRVAEREERGRKNIWRNNAIKIWWKTLELLGYID